MASCLTNRTSRPLGHPRRREHARPLPAEEFVRSGGTLYSLSKEGKGTAGPLVTALTVAVVEAAETTRRRLPRWTPARAPARGPRRGRQRLPVA
jgi:hypothetical protein